MIYEEFSEITGLIAVSIRYHLPSLHFILKELLQVQTSVISVLKPAFEFTYEDFQKIFDVKCIWHLQHCLFCSNVWL